MVNWKQSVRARTVGDLKELLSWLPDETPISRDTAVSVTLGHIDAEGRLRHFHFGGENATNYGCCRNHTNTVVMPMTVLRAAK